MPDRSQPATPKAARKSRPRGKQAATPATAPPSADTAASAGEAPRGQSEVDKFLLAQVAPVEDAPQEAQADPLAEYQEPDPLATAWVELDLRCPACNIVHYVPTCTFLNAEESPQLLQRLARGQFNLKRCPLCHRIEPVDYPYTVYIPARRLALQVRSEWEYHAGGGEEWYAARLEDFFDRWAERDVRIDVVFGLEQLLERYGDEVGGRQAAGGGEDEAKQEGAPTE